MSKDKKRDELITALAKLVNGLAVPISMSMPLGQAGTAYNEVRNLINDFGWTSTAEIEASLRAILDEKEKS